MSVALRLDKLDALTGALRALGGAWRFTVVFSDPASNDKLRWLAGDGRDFFAPSAQLDAAIRGAMERALADQLARGVDPPRLNGAAACAVAGAAARRHWLARLEGLRDVPIAADSPAWLAAKARRGLRPEVGRATDALYRDLQRALISARKDG